jgi:hypothetical protein
MVFLLFLLVVLVGLFLRWYYKQNKEVFDEEYARLYPRVREEMRKRLRH